MNTVTRSAMYNIPLTTKTLLEVHLTAIYEKGDNPSYPDEYSMTNWYVESIFLNGTVALQGEVDSVIEELIEKALDNDEITFLA